MNLKIGWGRFAGAFVLLLLTAAFLQARKRPEKTPTPEKLVTFPANFQDWESREVPIDPETQQVLGATDTLSRVYMRPSSPYVNLFIGYFASQRTGAAIHSPKNCLPGAGWAPMNSGVISIDVPGRSPIIANRYVIAKGNERNVVLYWYQSHGRAIASEYWAKFYLVKDSINLNRTDAALVRVITPVLPSEGLESAERRAVGFAQQVVPVLNQYVPD